MKRYMFCLYVVIENIHIHTHTHTHMWYIYHLLLSECDKHACGAEDIELTSRKTKVIAK